MKIGLISRKTELESIKLELAKILEEIETRLSEKEIKESEVVHLAQNADEFKSGINAENIIKVSQENNLQKEEFKNVELNDEMGVNESEIQEINEHIESINQREVNLNNEIATLNDRRKVLEDQVVVLDNDKVNKESGKVDVQNEITELKIVLAQKEERKDNVIASIEKLKKELYENKEELTVAYKEIGNCQEKTAVSENMITDLNKMLEDLQAEKVTLEEESVRLKEEQSVCNGQLTEKNRQVDEYDEEYKAHEHVINDLRLKENEFKIKAADLEERIRDDYQVALSEF
ncbi:MAG: hypothetical protein GY909_00565, partial [Oligoflexia bacterium]|nr:hypothetical protein [Oligoflexia bacterium]